MKRLPDMGVTALSLNINLNIFAIHKELKMMLMNFKLSLAACMAAMFLFATAVDVSAQTIERISVASDGTQANLGSNNSSMSPDGRYTVFSSGATNLVPGVTVQGQIYLRDRVLATTELISVSESGVPADQSSGNYARVSDNGRYTVFVSYAHNLVPGSIGYQAQNYLYQAQIYLRDRIENKTVLISKTVNGGPAIGGGSDPGISADGRYVVYSSLSNNLVVDDTNNLSDIFVYDRMTSQTQRISVSSAGVPGNNHSSTQPIISADGRYVAFSSTASNLVDNDTNNVEDVFVRDRVAGTTKRISVSSGGVQGDDISSTLLGDTTPDGRFIAFMSVATNLVSGDTNANRDIFVHDQKTGITERVSIAPNGGEFFGFWMIFPKVSDDGRYVAFSKRDAYGSNAYVRDRQNGVTTQFTFNGYPEHTEVSGISSTGRYVLLRTELPIVPEDTNNTADVFLVDQCNSCQY